MSKSKGNVVDPIELIDEFGAEQVKYFFASKIKMGQDGVFDKEILKNAINSELSNNFGNLLSRTIAMTKQNFEGAVQYKEEKLQDVDKNIFELIKIKTDEFISNFDEFNIDEAFNSVMNLSKKLNGYIDETKP